MNDINKNLWCKHTNQITFFLLLFSPRLHFIEHNVCREYRTQATATATITNHYNNQVNQNQYRNLIDVKIITINNQIHECAHQMSTYHSH